jgi:hypothetical protein
MWLLGVVCGVCLVASRGAREQDDRTRVGVRVWCRGVGGVVFVPAPASGLQRAAKIWCDARCAALPVDYGSIIVLVASM